MCLSMKRHPQSDSTAQITIDNLVKSFDEGARTARNFPDDSPRRYGFGHRAIRLWKIYPSAVHELSGNSRLRDDYY
jgi:hypothetical protein